MNQNNEKKDKNLILDIDEFTRNEEDLLAFSSKYKTNIYNEENINENDIEFRDVRKRLSGDSTSFSMSQEYSSVRGCNLKKINSTSKEEISYRSEEYSQTSKKFLEYQEKQRKMSSPIFYYFNGSDKYLSKNQKNTVDINNSQNFIKKESFFNNTEKKSSNANKSNQKNNKNNNNSNTTLLYQNKKEPSINNINNNIINNKNNRINNKKNLKHQKKLSLNMNQIDFNNMNYINGIQNNNFTTNNYFFNNNNYQQPIYNINYININNFKNNPVNNITRRKLSYNIEDGIINNYFNNILEMNNNTNPNEQMRIINIPQTQPNLNPILFSFNEEQENNYSLFNINRNNDTKFIPNSSKNEKKPFDKRKGDWLCPDCHNLNFAFRIVCNRCQLPKPTNWNKINGQ